MASGTLVQDAFDLTNFLATKRPGGELDELAERALILLNLGH
jgi:hypothetical protein